MFHTITKGELSVVRSALEENDPDARRDALEIIEGIIEKNVRITITEEMMYKDPMDEELTEEQVKAMLASEPPE
jgi:hypothetical protein